MKLRFSQHILNKHLAHDIDDAIVSGPMPESVSEYEFDNVFNQVTKSPLGKEVIRRGWITPTRYGASQNEEIASSMLGLLSHVQNNVQSPALFRGSAHLERRDLYNKLASYLWISKVVSIANTTSIGAFDRSAITDESVYELVHLSVNDRGPALAGNWLRQHGIHFVVLDSLPGMRLDGASMMLQEGNPLVALTLRYDRIDNFWFTLLHELGHIHLHLAEGEQGTFLDDFDDSINGDELEEEANAFAQDAFIPRPLWRRSDAYRLKTKKAIFDLADHLGIHPAIIAGRLRFENSDYRDFVELVGQGNVREVLKND